MNEGKNKKKRKEWLSMYAIAEYLILIYAVVTAIANLLNAVGMASIMHGLLKPTFWRASLIVLMLLQYELMPSNTKNKIVQKLRPCAMGTMAVCLLASDDIKYILWLLMLVGYFLLTGFKHKWDAKEATTTVLIASIEAEVYSVVLLLSDSTVNGINSFMSSVWLDVFFVFTSIVYCLVNREDEGKTNSNKLLMKLQSYSHKMIQCVGAVLCVISLGLFLYYQVSVGAALNKAENSGEDVYLLQHCDDPSLVLTVTENTETGKAKVAFAEYTGANNQKVSLLEMDDGKYKIIFLEPQYALLTYRPKGQREIPLSAIKPKESVGQLWTIHEVIPEQNLYAFYCRYNQPLSYQVLSEPEVIPELYVEAGMEGYEYFSVERTIADEFVTKMLAEHKDEFTPTTLMETIMGYLGSWSVVFYLLLSLSIVGILYAGKWIGNETALLCVVILAYMLGYASIIAIMLFFCVLFVLYINGYWQNSRKRESAEVSVIDECNEIYVYDLDEKEI